MPKSKGAKHEAVSSTSEDGGSDGSKEVQHTLKKCRAAKKSRYRHRSSLPEEVIELPTEHDEREDVINDVDTDNMEEMGKIGGDIEELHLWGDEQSSIALSNRSVSEDKVYHHTDLEVIVSS